MAGSLLRELENEPESVVAMLHCRIDVCHKCLFPINLEPIQRLALSRQPLSGRGAENTRTGTVRLLRPGWRRSRVSRHRSSEPRQWRVEPCRRDLLELISYPCSS